MGGARSRPCSVSTDGRRHDALRFDSRIAFDGPGAILVSSTIALLRAPTPSYADASRLPPDISVKVPRLVVRLSLTLALLAAPPAAEAQPAGKVARVGFLATGSLESPEQR